jgi:hypothetical protein
VTDEVVPSPKPESIEQLLTDMKAQNVLILAALTNLQAQNALILKALTTGFADIMTVLGEINQNIIEIVDAVVPGPAAAAILMITELKTGTIQTIVLPQGEVTKMSLVLKDDGKGASYVISGYQDSSGNPATAPTLPTPPTWSITGEVDPTGAALPPGTLASITAAADGMSAQVAQNTKLGSFSVNVSLPPSTDGTFAGATGADAVQIVADVATSVQITGTAN